MAQIYLIFYIALVQWIGLISTENPIPMIPDCSAMSEALKSEIRSYQPIVNTIVSAALTGEFKGHVFRELGDFIDQYGQRWTGTPGLEASIDFMLEKMQRDGLSDVKAESVIAPYKWTRGKEYAELLEPFNREFRILAQTPSVSTSEAGIEAEVIVFSDLDELEANSTLVSGKIVVFDYNYTGYNEALPYRRQASSLAAKYGALATLVRSTTPFSLNSPHTSGVSYDPEYPKIPTASLTVEDSALLRRLQEKGKTIRLKLVLLNSMANSTETRNAMGQLQGSTLPEELVILAGHIDALDVGTGALDDGSGVFMATESLVLIQKLGLPRPKRTIRAVLFTAEEIGLVGATQYVQTHKDEMNKTVIAFEADIGAFRPLGLDFAGSEEAACILHEILQLLPASELNSSALGWYNESTPISSDIIMLQLEGVPIISLNNEGQWDYYFWFHHSDADTMSALKTEELDMNLALWASVSYVLADLSVALPRGNQNQGNLLKNITN
jgi:carboxypeptidase Q